MEDCIFCKIVAGEVPSSKLYEDAQTLAFLDLNPINPGHTLVVPKAHYTNLYDTPDEALSQVAATTKRVAKALKESLGADGINIEQNNEPAAGQVVMHLHTHVIPRHEGDGHKHWEGRSYEDGEMEELAAKLRAQLSS